MKNEDARAFMEMLRAHHQQNAAIEAAYRVVDRHQLRNVLVLEYRCQAHGCLLLHAWKASGHVLFFKPPYRLSPGRNLAESSESGRAKNTMDGDRRWRGRAGVLDQLRGCGDQVAMPMQCDHVALNHPVTQVLADADAAQPGKPTRRFLCGVVPTRG